MMMQVDARMERSEMRFLEAIKNEGYTVNEGSGYERSGKHVELNCPIGHCYLVTPNKFQQGRRCPWCGKRAKKNTEYFKKEVEIIDDAYQVVGRYVNARTPLLMKHDCGRTISIAPTNFLKGRGCKACSVKQRGLESRLTHKEYQENVDLITEGEYEVISEYITSEIKVKIRHKECGYEWRVYPFNFTFHNSRCPNCRDSRGERAISEYLDKNKIIHEKYKKFDDLKHKRKLECDFYLPLHKMIIEFDGGQHFRPVEHFGGEKTFREVKVRDRIKDEYAKSKNLTMLRIPYWDIDNIEEILKEKLN